MTFDTKKLIGFLVLAVCGVASAAPARAEILESADGSAPIIFTTMTHTDGTTYSTSKTYFQGEVDDMRWGIDLYDEYGVKMNLEASKDFATANTKWNDRILSEVLARGHGVGTHANDVNPYQIESVSSLSRKITANKRAVDALVGAANNVSISGICSSSDWVTAASMSRFKITDAATGLCYLSMDESVRPDGWTDALIKSTYYHDSAPFDFEDRISPIRLKDASDFEADADGTLTLSNGEIGELASLAEGRTTCGTSCALSEEDFDVVYQAIEDVVALKDPSQVGRINLHVPVRIFDASNESLLRSFLVGLKAYVDEGIIVFGTQKDVSNTYDAWK